jgi:hypothetical protein
VKRHAAQETLWRCRSFKAFEVDTPVSRSVDPGKHQEHSSGKKKAHTDKHIVR